MNDIRRILLGAKKRLTLDTWESPVPSGYITALSVDGSRCFWGDSLAAKFSIIGMVFNLCGEDTGLRCDVLAHLKSCLPKEHQHLDSLERTLDIDGVHSFLDVAAIKTYPFYLRPLLWLGLKEITL